MSKRNPLAKKSFTDPEGAIGAGQGRALTGISPKGMRASQKEGRQAGVLKAAKPKLPV